jgi:putative hydrolase of the HAD superfamily
VSNSCSGAREAERHHGFEAVVDDLAYSHEVGVAKPDREIYDLAAVRLGVAPGEIAFLDDSAACVDGARAAGWHAVRHEVTEHSIAAVEAVIVARR